MGFLFATCVIGDFNTPLSTMHGQPKKKKKINTDIVRLNDTLDQMDLIDIRKAFHHKEAKYTFKCTWTTGQDGDVGRYTLPSCTTKSRTTNLKAKNNQNCQKIEL